LVTVAAGATVNECSQILARHVLAQYGATDSSRSKMLFKEAYVSECGASMYGAGLIDSLDAHDGQVLTKGHIGVAILPVLLAQQNVNQLSGKEFLDALIIGYEIGTQAGIALHATAKFCCTDGKIDIICCPHTDGRDALFGCRIYHLASVWRNWVTPLTINIEFRVIIHSS